jgi:hypothetical protein
VSSVSIRNFLMRSITRSPCTISSSVWAHIGDAWGGMQHVLWLDFYWVTRTHACGKFSVTVCGLRISQWWLWRVLSSGMWCYVAWWKSTDISDEHAK